MKPLRTPQDLARAGLIAEGRFEALEAVAARYAIAVTPAMAALAQGPDDPIGRQFLPAPEELTTAPDEDGDPIGDAAHSPVTGIVHRYPDRVLLTLTHVCAVYCRFCFRRERVGPGGAKALTAAQIEAAIAYIAARPAIWEVILTGGDPLVLSPRRLRSVMGRLAAIEHVKVVRFHTRVPAVDPAAVTDDLVAALKSSGKATYVALHANHADELTPAARAACARIIEAGVPMLSQSVLLKGVNDSPQALEDLMRAFVETRIRPYYLHHLDKAPGTAHFRVGVERGQDLMRALRGRVSGLAQPTYVLDIPGGAGKVPVGPQYLEGENVRDPAGGRHARPS